MNQIVDPVAAALAQATQVAQQTTVATPVANLPTAVGATPLPAMPAGRKPTMDDLDTAGFAVDNFLKVDKSGIQVGKDADAGIHQKLVVGIDMNAVVAVECVSMGSPVKYFTTKNGATDERGKPWQQILSMAAAEGKSPYITAQIPMEILEEATATNGKKTPAGASVGYTPPQTGVREFQGLRRAMNEAGVARGKIEIGYKIKSGNGFTWAVMTFTYLGPWD
jgi:hypothetical protein